ncbi:hypothetical protein VHEMI08193 [[Torrubiella] hemipterigena]|uniref:DUF1993 domain-containing protein n=1 Tax=[Torrubiella] hemipterigena TaxID=1531966 RepID=A0A0A1TP92_9HYPO|nr:hypothetical protein VHEMI08193 [[Torrubiella] hemipterigena]
MTYNPYASVVVPSLAAMASFSNILTKASHHDGADASSLLAARLYPDMKPIGFRVWAATNCAARLTARLAGADLPGWADDLVTFDDMLARIKEVQDYMRTFDEATINGRLKEPIYLRPDYQTEELQPYSSEAVAFGSSLPTILFHLTIAYSILRSEGVPLDKEDFIQAFSEGYKPITQ